MMSLKAKRMSHTNQASQTDHEAVFIASLHDAMIEDDIPIGQDEIANFYVALKSKPLTILAGPAQSGKIALVQGLTQLLVERESLRFQMFTGHPWWAERSDGIASHTGLHARFSTEKMLSIIEEAGQPENTHQIFIACLARISPAELLSFFTEVAFQLQHGQVMRLGDTHLSVPIPFPPNLRIIGTMDTPSFGWWDKDLLLNTTVIQWAPAGVLQGALFNRGVRLDEYEFFQSSIRNRDAAYYKIFPYLKQQRQPLYPLLRVEAILKRYATSLELVTDEIMIYLANSWTRLGRGLFHPLPDRNFAIALDLAIAQILLPRAADAIQSIKTLRKRLNLVFADQFRHSTAFVSGLSDQG